MLEPKYSPGSIMPDRLCYMAVGPYATICATYVGSRSQNIAHKMSIDSVFSYICC